MKRFAVKRDPATSGRVTRAHCLTCSWDTEEQGMETLTRQDNPVGVRARRHVARHGHDVVQETTETSLYVPS